MNQRMTTKQAFDQWIAWCNEIGKGLPKALYVSIYQAVPGDLYDAHAVGQVLSMDTDLAKVLKDLASPAYHDTHAVHVFDTDGNLVQCVLPNGTTVKTQPCFFVVRDFGDGYDETPPIWAGNSLDKADAFARGYAERRAQDLAEQDGDDPRTVDGVPYPHPAWYILERMIRIHVFNEDGIPLSERSYNRKGELLP